MLARPFCKRVRLRYSIFGESGINKNDNERKAKTVNQCGIKCQKIINANFAKLNEKWGVQCIDLTPIPVLSKKLTFPTWVGRGFMVLCPKTSPSPVLAKNLHFKIRGGLSGAHLLPWLCLLEWFIQRCPDSLAVGVPLKWQGRAKLFWLEIAWNGEICKNNLPRPRFKVTKNGKWNWIISPPRVFERT